jgi:aminoglycoside phosphotransferase family enzyme/predicted kinase
MLEYLKNPAFYGSNIESVKVLQTHISFVALTGEYAYKVKKPVNFGFLDFSTLEKRKYFCEEEMRLNKRLCRNIYLDVIPIAQKNNLVRLNGKGEIIDYALKMKEFSQDKIMTNLMKKGKIDEEVIDKICTILVDFYNSGEHSDEIDKYGEVKSIKQNIDENFEQTKSIVDVAIPKDIYEYIKNVSNTFFYKKKDVFEQRIKEEHIHDCHGDLHSGNIVVTDKIYIFDCIEFNKRFRFCDVASDISFLAMDLDYLNYPFLSSYLINSYVEKSKDDDIFNVLNFYKSYRAYVRGKINGFRLNDPTVDKKEKKLIIETAKKYFDLSHYYASLFSIELNGKKPLLFMVSGLTGTGKSTLALKIAVDYHAHQINTDIVRKELAGIDKFERHHNEFNTGLYVPKKIDFTYEKVMEKAADFLKKGKNVVLDATFQKKKYRDMTEEIAEENNALLIRIRCICPDKIVKKWLEKRLKKKSVSDGRWEIYQKQKDMFEPLVSGENHIKVNTSEESYEYRMNFFRNLLKIIIEA